MWRGARLRATSSRTVWLGLGRAPARAGFLARITEKTAGNGPLRPAAVSTPMIGGDPNGLSGGWPVGPRRGWKPVWCSRPAVCRESRFGVSGAWLFHLPRGSFARRGFASSAQSGNSLLEINRLDRQHNGLAQRIGTSDQGNGSAHRISTTDQHRGSVERSSLGDQPSAAIKRYSQQESPGKRHRRLS